MCHGCVFFEQGVKFAAGGVFHVRFRLADRGFEIENLLLDGEQLAEDRVLAVHSLVLCQVAKARVLCEGHAACVRRKSAGDDPEQCGFACAVDADDRRLLRILYMKGSIFDDMVVDKSLVYIAA